MSDLEFSNKRQELLLKARAFEISMQETAKFDQLTLRERLMFSLPLQRLYERVYFDSF